jgi:hypothetical protein
MTTTTISRTWEHEGQTFLRRHALDHPNAHVTMCNLSCRSTRGVILAVLGFGTVRAGTVADVDCPWCRERLGLERPS